MRTIVALMALALLGAGGFYFYSTSQNTINGLTGPRFNLAVRNEPALVEIDLGEEIAGFEGYRMRARYVVVKPGATIRIHNHVGRPAFSYVVNTTVDEYRSDAPGVIPHQPGDLTADVNIAQWWRNTGGVEARFYVVDIYQPLGNKGE